MADKCPPEVTGQSNYNSTKHASDDSVLKSKNKRQKHRMDNNGKENVVASKQLRFTMRNRPNQLIRKGGSRQKEDSLSKSSRKKMKA